MKIRLHQFLSKCGIFESKNDVKKAIWSGEIEVNGSIMKDMKFEFNTNKTSVTYRGTILELPTKNYYFIVNKPTGYICSRLSSQEKILGKKSIFEIFKNNLSKSVYQSLVTVGRLDEDTTGLLLVTTDGKLVDRITNPNNHVPKKYLVDTELDIVEEEVSAIRKGVDIKIIEENFTEKYTSRPAKIILQDSNQAILIIDEGKKRQIRRMFDSMGNYVVSIHRLAIGNMNLDDFNINQGEFEEITLEKINKTIIMQK